MAKPCCAVDPIENEEDRKKVCWKRYFLSFLSLQQSMKILWNLLKDTHTSGLLLAVSYRFKKPLENEEDMKITFTCIYYRNSFPCYVLKKPEGNEEDIKITFACIEIHFLVLLYTFQQL